MIKISVVIPTHNRFPILQQCLKALAGQSFPHTDFEVILVDDGSEDETKTELVPLLKEFPFKSKHFRQKPSGPSKARNKGIENSEGQIILVMGDDIIAVPHLLEEHWLAHSKLGTNTIVIGKVTWDPNLTITPFMHYLEKGLQFSFHTLTNETVSYRHCYTANISFTRSSLLEKEVLFSEDFPYAAFEDIEWGYRLFKNNFNFNYTPEALGYHHHPVTLKSYKKRMIYAGRAWSHLIKIHPDIGQKEKRKSKLSFFFWGLKTNYREALLSFTPLRKVLFSSKPNKLEEKWIRSILGYYLEKGKLQGIKGE